MSTDRPTVLISGCSSGIGLATARRLASAGWTVYAGVRSGVSSPALEHSGCRPLELDVRDEAGAQNAVARVLQECESIDALINNAGFGLHGVVEEVSLEQGRLQFETNFFGAVRLCQLVLPRMRSQRRGRIVNMSSMGGRLTFPVGGFYHASKHALEALSDALRWEVAPFGVHVILLEPGPVRSSFGRTGIETLANSREDSPYADLVKSAGDALRSTFEGSTSEQACSPDRVAQACERALTAPQPAARYIVGEMAEQLIEQRLGQSDAEWDSFLESIYVRPRASETN